MYSSTAIKRYIDKAVERELMRRRVDEALNVKKANKSDKLSVRRRRKDGPSDVALKAVLNVEYALDKIKSLIGDSEGKAKAIWNAAVNAVKSSKVANKGYDKVASLLDKLKQTVLDKTARRLTQRAIEEINKVAMENGGFGSVATPIRRGVVAASRVWQAVTEASNKLPKSVRNNLLPLDEDNKFKESPWKYLREILFRARHIMRNTIELDQDQYKALEKVSALCERGLKELKSYGDMPKSK